MNINQQLGFFYNYITEVRKLHPYVKKGDYKIELVSENVFNKSADSYRLKGNFIKQKTFFERLGKYTNPFERISISDKSTLMIDFLIYLMEKQNIDKKTVIKSLNTICPDIFKKKYDEFFSFISKNNDELLSNILLCPALVLIPENIKLSELNRYLDKKNIDNKTKFNFFIELFKSKKKFLARNQSYAETCQILIDEFKEESQVKELSEFFPNLTLAKTDADLELFSETKLYVTIVLFDSKKAELSVGAKSINYASMEILLERFCNYIAKKKSNEFKKIKVRAYENSKHNKISEIAIYTNMPYSEDSFKAELLNFFKFVKENPKIDYLDSELDVCLSRLELEKSFEVKKETKKLRI